MDRSKVSISGISIYKPTIAPTRGLPPLGGLSLFPPVGTKHLDRMAYGHWEKGEGLINISEAPLPFSQTLYPLPR